MNFWINFFNIFIYVFYSNISLNSSKTVIKWNKAFLKLKKETHQFVFGVLHYKINNKKIRSFTYQNLNDSILRKICEFSNYDNYTTFSMKFNNRISVKVIDFNSRNENMEKF